MVRIPDAVLAELAEPVARALPLIAARVPPAPAAELGRLQAPPQGDTRPKRFRAARPGQTDSPVRDALASLPPLLIERLVGALELTVPTLNPTGAPDLTGLLGEPFTGKVGIAGLRGQSEAVTGATMLDQVRPGVLPLVAELARGLARHPHLATLGTVDPRLGEEPEIAAAHGTAHLALAVATAAAVLPRTGIPTWALTPPALLGVAIGAAVLLLREAPMPAGYAAAALARARAEYQLPLHSSGSARVSAHRFALLEGTDVPQADFSANGLVAVVPGGVVVRTGIEAGQVRVFLNVLAAPPPELATSWDEVVEISWHAEAGSAAVLGPATTGATPAAGTPVPGTPAASTPAAGTSPDRASPDRASPDRTSPDRASPDRASPDRASTFPGEPQLRGQTPPWPGDYRLRVHANGRDDVEEGATEQYSLVVWQAPPGPEIVHARTDRLGSRLRGEPEPPRPDRPETAYRWLPRSALGEAATITMVTGMDAADVLRAFDADPTHPESMRAISEELAARQSIDPWVAVLDLGGAVLAVEYNGWHGSDEQVLSRASAAGRAASMYWNVNALTRLSFAEHGEMLLSTEPFTALDAPEQVAPAVAGLDFADVRRGKRPMGVLAVARFTGVDFTAADLARLEAADIAFRILPDLPTLHPRPPRPGRPLAGPPGPTPPPAHPPHPHPAARPTRPTHPRHLQPHHPRRAAWPMRPSCPSLRCATWHGGRPGKRPGMRASVPTRTSLPACPPVP